MLAGWRACCDSEQCGLVFPVRPSSRTFALAHWGRTLQSILNWVPNARAKEHMDWLLAHSRSREACRTRTSWHHLYWRLARVQWERDRERGIGGGIHANPECRRSRHGRTRQQRRRKKSDNSLKSIAIVKSIRVKASWKGDRQTLTQRALREEQSPQDLSVRCQRKPSKVRCECL